MTSIPERLFLANATLIDGIADTALTNRTVVVEGDRIDWVGPAADAPRPTPGDTVHDLTGQTLLPGFMDAHVHVHLLSSDSLNPATALHEPESLAAYRRVVNLRRTLDAGVTMVRDLSGTDYGTVIALEQGLIEGPRMITAVRGISPTGGHGDMRTLRVPFNDYHDAACSTLTTLADSVTEARRTARELVRVGAGVIKVMGTGGVWSPRDAPEHLGLGIPEMKAIVEVADNHGIYVASHAQGAQGIKNALRAGVKSIEHGYFIDDEGIELMLENDAWLVPTLLAATTPPDPAKATPYQVEKKNRVRAQVEKHIARAFEAGVKVALGTDSAVIPHGQNLREIGLMVDLGLDPMKAIKAGTASTAELFGVADARGVVRAGMLADLVVTPIDPLKNPHGLGDPASIVTVFQAGRLVKSAG